MASEIHYALDTNVVVAATIGPADRLWSDWSRFDATEATSRFVPSLVREEFYAVVEGIGSPRPGVVDQVVSDTLIAIRLGMASPPTEIALAAAGITGNRLQKVRLLLADFHRQSRTWDQEVARGLLREFERGYAVRKTDFFERHPVNTSLEPSACAATRLKLAPLVPNGGQSWLRDCEILAQVNHILAVGAANGHFVTEDAHHIGRHAKQIVQLTVIQGIRNLSGTPFHASSVRP